MSDALYSMVSLYHHLIPCIDWQPDKNLTNNLRPYGVTYHGVRIYAVNELITTKPMNLMNDLLYLTNDL